MEPSRNMFRHSPGWCVYILSNNAHTLYVGSTNELLRRTAEHRLKIHANAFTARYTFDRCVYFEFLPDEVSARAREKQIKGWTRARKIALIEESNPWWNDITPKIEDLLQRREHD